MALAEIGARLRLQGAPAFRRDAERAAGATDRLGREIGQMDRQAGIAKRGLSGLAKGIGGLGRAAGGLPGLLGAAAGGGLAVFGLSLLDTATQMEGLSNKAKVVFGSELAGVQKWAAKASEAMGLSATQATGLAAGMADLLIPMGFSRKAAAKMSTDLTGLSGALAQWSGGTRSATEVAEMLQGAIMGDAAALESLGIGIGAADIEARLLAKGQSKLTDAALKQAEAQAIIELTFEKSTDAQKGYADGANKLGLQQAKLSAKVQTLRERFAAKLTPFFIDALGWVEKHMPSIERSLDGLATKLSEAINPGSNFRKEMADLWPALKQVGAFAKDVLKKAGDLVSWMADHQTTVKNFAAMIVGLKIGFAGLALMNFLGIATGIAATGTAAGGAAVGVGAFSAALGPLFLAGGAVALSIIALKELFDLMKATSNSTGGGTVRSPGYGEQYTDPKTGKPVGLPGLTKGTPLPKAKPKGGKGGVPYKAPYVYKPPPKLPASVTGNMTGSGSPAPIIINNTTTLDGKVLARSTRRVFQDEAARR